MSSCSTWVVCCKSSSVICSSSSRKSLPNKLGSMKFRKGTIAIMTAGNRGPEDSSARQNDR